MYKQALALNNNKGWYAIKPNTTQPDSTKKAQVICSVSLKNIFIENAVGLYLILQRESSVFGSTKFLFFDR